MYGGLFYAQTGYAMPSATTEEVIFSGWIAIPLPESIWTEVPHT